MWECPNCKRQFKNDNQMHGCHSISIDDHLKRRSDKIGMLFQHLDKYIHTLGEFRSEAVPPDVVFYKTESTFLALKLKTRWIDVEFFLDHYDDDPLIKKWLQTSKNRFAHIVSIDEVEEINVQLKNWIKASYTLISK